MSLVSPQWGFEWSAGFEQVAGFVLSFVRVGTGFVLSLVRVGAGFVLSLVRVGLVLLNSGVRL